MVQLQKTIQERAELIIEDAAFFASRGWLPATSGNLSTRISLDEILITRSGADKARLGLEDFLLVNLEGEPIDSDLKSSAETALHTQLYKHSEEIACVYHVHSPASVVLSKLFQVQASGEQGLILEDYELLKALSGVTTHKHREYVPIFDNTQNIDSLAADLDALMKVKQGLHAYIIAGHGFYTWGMSCAEARRQVEACEALFEMEIRLWSN